MRHLEHLTLLSPSVRKTVACGSLGEVCGFLSLFGLDFLFFGKPSEQREDVCDFPNRFRPERSMAVLNVYSS